ncbi:unnamed protein product, partial [Ixodes persulcatus]
GNYQFGYNEQHGTGGTSRWESGDGAGNKKGSYSLRGADGRTRTVKYVADGGGFRASIHTNEPGTAPSSPASAGINAPVLATVGATVEPTEEATVDPTAEATEAPTVPVWVLVLPRQPTFSDRPLLERASAATGATVLEVATAATSSTSIKLSFRRRCVIGGGIPKRVFLQAVVFLGVLAVASAGYVGGPVVAVPESGASSGHRAQDYAGNYNFGYKEAHTTGGSFRQETGDAYGNKAGSYGITDADGRVRIVKYVADAAGFRVHVSTNEPGTAKSTPAAAGFNAPVVAPAPVAHYAVAKAPVVAYSAAPYAGYAAPAAHYGYAAPVLKAPVTAAHVYGPAIAGPAYGAGA